MRLVDYLTKEFAVQELKKFARALQVEKYSLLRKDALADEIAKAWCANDFLRTRLETLTDEEMEIFRKACVKPQEIGYEFIIDSMNLVAAMTGGFDPKTDYFCVYEEIKEAFGEIDDEDFRQMQRKKGWLMHCIRFFHNYYGIAPLEVIYRLYCQKIKTDSIEEMVDLLSEMPADIIEVGVFAMEAMGMQDWPEDDPIYSDRGLLVQLSLLEEDEREFDWLLDNQMDKDFFIPSRRIIVELSRQGYEQNIPAYEKLMTYFMKRHSQTFEQARMWCMRIHANSYDGEMPGDIMDRLDDAGIKFHEDRELNDFLRMLMDAHNNTRIKENRGHTPNELAKGHLFAPGRMPVIVPGSAHAAAMLREAAPELARRGISVDPDGSADVLPGVMYPHGLDQKPVVTQTKVYPNDMCPCGSGKKYKKCCGRLRG